MSAEPQTTPPKEPEVKEPPFDLGPVVEPKKASFDKETGIVDFGGYHLYHLRGETALHESGLDGYETSFTLKPKNELAFGEIYQDGRLAPGGSGMKFAIPKDGFDEPTLAKIDEFVSRINKITANIQAKAPEIVVYENGQDVRRQPKYVVVSDKLTVSGLAELSKNYGKNHRIGSNPAIEKAELEVNGPDYDDVMNKFRGTTPFFNLERAALAAHTQHKTQGEYQSMRGGRGYTP